MRAPLRTRAAARRIALVGHSLGAMVILRMFGDPALRAEFADVIAQIEQVVLVSPVDFAVERPPPEFEDVVGLASLQVTLGNLLGVLRERVASSLIAGAADPERMPREEADRMVEVLWDDGTRGAAQRMISEAVPFGADRRPDWPRIEALVADYRRLDRPCLLLCGARDETFPCAMSYKLRAQLPDARLQILERSKHSPQFDQPRECARIVRDYLGEGWRDAPPIIDAVLGQDRGDE